MTIAALEPNNRVQLPREWVKELQLSPLIVLGKNAEGILIRPCPRFTWDDIFADKLVIGSAPVGENENIEEATGDDFLF